MSKLVGLVVTEPPKVEKPASASRAPKKESKTAEGKPGGEKTDGK